MNDKKEPVIHKTAHIDKGAVIGIGTKIWHNTHVTKTAKVGKDCNIGKNCYIAGMVGNECRIQNNVNIYQGVTLGNYVFCGPNMTFTNDINPRAKYPKYGNWLPTKVDDGVTFGAGSVIVCGTEIGQHSFIGAGSVVTKDVLPFALVFGNPAKLKGWICECGQKMPFEFQLYSCPKCNKQYKKQKNLVSKVSQ